MRRWKVGAGALLLAVGWLLGMATARAQSVDEIVSRGSINIGVLVDLPLYGRLDDKQEPDNLHQWVNTFMYFTKNNGELDALWQKWFHKPLPVLPTF